MKKIFVAFVAVMALYACSSGEKDLKYRGLSMAKPDEKFRLMLAQKDGILLALQENYKISTNDSTRHLWQQLRDDFEKELGAWPNCPILKDDHKVAKFETDGGFVTLTLENTYRPTFSVLYEVKK